MSILLTVFELKKATSKHHRDKNDDWWLVMLVEEIGELAAALRGKHEHPPELELMQIASICLNWLDKRESRQLCEDLLKEHYDRMKRDNNR